MSEHLTAREVERYSRRALPPPDLIETDAHLASCAACRQLLRENEGTGVAINHLRAGLHAEGGTELEHPSHVQLAAYADQQLKMREPVRAIYLLCGRPRAGV